MTRRRRPPNNADALRVLARNAFGSFIAGEPIQPKELARSTLRELLDEAQSIEDEDAPITEREPITIETEGYEIK